MLFVAPCRPVYGGVLHCLITWLLGHYHLAAIQILIHIIPTSVHLYPLTAPGCVVDEEQLLTCESRIDN